MSARSRAHPWFAQTPQEREHWLSKSAEEQKAWTGEDAPLVWHRFDEKESPVVDLRRAFARLLGGGW